MDFSPLIKDGAIRVTEANRKALKKWVIDTYLNPKKQAFQSGNLSSTAARIGIPELYVGDKQVFLTSVGKFLGGKIKNVGFGSSGADANKQREDTLKKMTSSSGDVTKYGRGARGLKINQEDHHILFRTLFEPFYKGRSEAEAKELTEFFVQQHAPLGNVLANLQAVDKEFHKGLIHTIAKEMNIEVPAGGPGDTNFRGGGVRGGAGGEDEALREVGRAVMPNFEHLSINELLPAASEYVELIVPKLREYTANAVHAEELVNEIQGGPKATNPKDLIAKWETEAADYAAKSQLKQDWGVTDKDLSVGSNMTIKANQPPKHKWLTNPLKTNLPTPLPNPIADKENAPIKALENVAAFGLEQSVNLAGSGIGDPNLGTKGRKILTGAKKISEGKNIEGGWDILSNASITTNQPVRSQYKSIQRDLMSHVDEQQLDIMRFEGFGR